MDPDLLPFNGVSFGVHDDLIGAAVFPKHDIAVPQIGSLSIIEGILHSNYLNVKDLTKLPKVLLDIFLLNT